MCDRWRTDAGLKFLVLRIQVGWRIILHFYSCTRLARPPYIPLSPFVLPSFFISRFCCPRFFIRLSLSLSLLLEQWRATFGDWRQWQQATINDSSSEQRSKPRLESILLFSFLIFSSSSSLFFFLTYVLCSAMGLIKLVSIFVPHISVSLIFSGKCSRNEDSCQFFSEKEPPSWYLDFRFWFENSSGARSSFTAEDCTVLCNKNAMAWQRFYIKPCF